MMRHSPGADQVVCRYINKNEERTCVLSTLVNGVFPRKCRSQPGIDLLIAVLAYSLAISFIQVTITRCFNKIQTNLKLQEAWWSQFTIWGWAAIQTLTKQANHPLNPRLMVRKSCVSACNQLLRVKLLMWTWQAQPAPTTLYQKTQFRWRCNTRPCLTITQTLLVPTKRLATKPTSTALTIFTLSFRSRILLFQTQEAALVTFVVPNQPTETQQLPREEMKTESATILISSFQLATKSPLTVVIILSVTQLQSSLTAMMTHLWQ